MKKSEKSVCFNNLYKMYATEKQMNFCGKHSCIQEKLVILSNADLISYIDLLNNAGQT